MQLVEHVQTLGHYVPYHPSLNNITGGCLSTILLYELMFQEKHFQEYYKRPIDADGMDIPEATLMQRTGMSRSELRTARKMLRSQRLVGEVTKGHPRRNFYQLQHDIIDLKWNAYRDTEESDLQKLRRQKAQNLQCRRSDCPQSDQTERTDKSQDPVRPNWSQYSDQFGLTESDQIGLTESDQIGPTVYIFKKHLKKQIKRTKEYAHLGDARVAETESQNLDLDRDLPPPDPVPLIAPTTETAPTEDPQSSLSTSQNEVTPTPTQIEGSAAPAKKSSKNKKKASTQAQKIPSGGLELEFQEFYDRYPRKKDRPQALKTYIRHRESGVEANAILSALEREHREWIVTERPRDRIPYPSTWLNQEAWLNPIDDVQIPYEAQLNQFYTGYVGSCVFANKVEPGSLEETQRAWLAVMAQNPDIAEQIATEIVETAAFYFQIKLTGRSKNPIILPAPDYLRSGTWRLVIDCKRKQSGLAPISENGQPSASTNVEEYRQSNRAQRLMGLICDS